MGRPCDGHAVIGFLDFRSLCGPSVPAPFMLHLLRAAVGQCLTNRSKSPVSGIGPEADTAAHNFMGFDPGLVHHTFRTLRTRQFEPCPYTSGRRAEVEDTLSSPWWAVPQAIVWIVTRSELQLLRADGIRTLAGVERMRRGSDRHQG